jgi:2-oxoglutarate ferredoxin oxidoreductase subunit alpha
MEKVLMKGNEAIAEAAIMAGCRHFFGYPITPQTEVAAYMAKRMPQVDGVYLQAESEVASINMILGASAAGARVLTSSSSPGISLMAEGISYLAGCDLPAVIVNIQRGGPGLGGIQPSQADYYQATRSTGHGDFHVLVLAPNSVQEMADLTMKAFDLADAHRMPAMLLGDGILGQMMEPVLLNPRAPQAVAKPWAVGAGKKSVINSLWLNPALLEKTNIERFERYKKAEEEVMWEEHLLEDAEIVAVAYGAASRITKSAIAMARAKGIKAGLLRPITLWPFPKKPLEALAEKAASFVAVELSMGQMIDDVRLATKCKKPVLFSGRTGGMVHTPEEVLEKIEEAAKGVEK